ncbi:MAG: hypothetical protein WKG01_41355, partial [Kofleriaceae bacterium]
MQRGLDDVALALGAERGAQRRDRRVHGTGVEPAPHAGIAPDAGARALQQHVTQAIDGSISLEERAQQRPLGLAARVALAEQRRERLIERDLVGDLRLLEQALRRERILDEDPVAEPVNREDRRVIERGDRGSQARTRGVVDAPVAVALVGARVPRQPIEHVADAHAQLGDGLLGERDEQQLTELGATEDQVDDAMLEEVRLAGTRRRLDDDEPIARRRQRLWTRDTHHGHGPPRRCSKPWSPLIRSTSGPSLRSAIAVTSGGGTSPSR